MRNHWIVYKDPIVSWRAMIPRSRSLELAAFQRLLLQAGEELAVYRVVAVPDLGYQRDVHGPLSEFLNANPQLDDGILLFEHEHSASSRLAYVDDSGRCSEDEVTDLGVVQAAAPTEAPVRHRPPLQLWSTATPIDSSRITVTLDSWSDIWLPWSSARHEKGRDIDDFADNSALARRHTPRLNTFLDRLRERTYHIGGLWELDRSVTDRDVLFEVDDHGIHLDAEQPLDRISEAPPPGPRRDDLLGALRYALAFVSHDPPPPPYHPVVRAVVDNPAHEMYTADRAEVLQALRCPVDTSRLTRAELRDVTKVEVDNAAGRHAFSAEEVAD